MSSLAERLTSSSEETEDSLDYQFDVLKVDYERTLGLLDGIVRVSTTLRATGLTAFAAFVGLGVEQKSWALMAAASVLAALFAVYDSYQQAVYRGALRRANALERLFQHRLRALDRPYDPYPRHRLRREVEKYRFGALGNLPKTRLRDAILRRPHGFVLLFLLLATGAGAGAPIVD
jgi:hypothetical protein